MKKYSLVEKELKKVLGKVLSEQQNDTKSRKEKVEDVKPRCIPENVIPLSEIVGQADEYSKYAPGVSKRAMGVNSMVDTLGILNNIR